MVDEPFAFGNSRLHAIDPRLRVAAAAGFSVIVAISSQMTALVTALAVSFAMILAARLDLLRVARRLGVVAAFLLLIWIVLPVTMQGPVAYRLGPLDLTATGIRLALQITLKSVAILATLTALLATMTVATLGQALHRLGVPKKIVYLLLITYRYIFVLEAEYRRLLTAARIRSFRPRTSLHAYRTYAYLVGMLFVRATVRSERVLMAMKCRGFNGRFYSLTEFTPHPGNRVFAILTTLTLTGLAALEWWRYAVGT
jgi:cobalt/nickel transport system permease protein